MGLISRVSSRTYRNFYQKMSGFGFYRGTSHEQNLNFKNKQKQLLKTMKFSSTVKNAKRRQVNMKQIKFDTVKPWITSKITEALGFEDEIVIEMVFNQLEAEQFPDPKTLQINITGFLNAKKARDLVGELWPMLVSACENGTGIPTVILEKKKREIEDREKTAQDLDDILKKAREGGQPEVKKPKIEPINLDGDDEEQKCEFNPPKDEIKPKSEAIEVLDSDEEEEIRKYQMAQTESLKKVEVKDEAEAAKFLEDLRRRAMESKEKSLSSTRDRSRSPIR